MHQPARLAPAHEHPYLLVRIYDGPGPRVVNEEVEPEPFRNRFLRPGSGTINQKMELKPYMRLVWIQVQVENNMERKSRSQEKFSKIEIICRVSGLQVVTKVEPDRDPFTYRSLNKCPNPIFNRSKPPGNRTIRTQLHPYLLATLFGSVCHVQCAHSA